MHSTTALSGGFRYNPTTSVSFSVNAGSVDNLKVSMRWGCRPCASQIRCTVERLTPAALAIERQLQCVAPGGVSCNVACTKRQLTKRGIAYESLDNGILRCADPERMQRLADGLTAAKVDALLRKWLARLPHPFNRPDRQQGIRYDISMLQAEFALTQVFDRPAQGRVFFEEVLRENLDMGRPDHVQLIFDRRVNRRTPSRYRTRVITDGVIPSLHVDYKHSRIKQYHKEGRALRTETVINDTYDFAVGRRLSNLDDLKKIGFAANRRLLGVQRLSHDCTLGADVLDELHRPVCIDGQRASALRFGDRRVQSLFAALLRFDLLPQGFRNRDLREAVAALCGLSPDDYGAGRMTYDLRRLRLRGIIERIARTQRYRLTAEGLCVALAYHRTQARVLGPVLSATLDGESTTRLREAVAPYDREVDRAWPRTGPRRVNRRSPRNEATECPDPELDSTVKITPVQGI